MSLTLHKENSDGSITHEPFSKISWELAMRDPSVSRFWAHDPMDCHDPVQRIRSGKISISQDPEIVEPEPVWPPDGPPLWAELLRDMTTLGLEDSREILAPPKRTFAEVGHHRAMVKGDQMTLF